MTTTAFYAEALFAALESLRELGRPVTPYESALKTLLAEIKAAERERNRALRKAEQSERDRETCFKANEGWASLLADHHIAAGTAEGKYFGDNCPVCQEHQAKEERREKRRAAIKEKARAALAEAEGKR